MAYSHSPVFPGKPIADVVAVPSGGTTPVTLYTAPTEGTLIKHIWVYQKGSLARGLKLEYVKSGTAYSVANYTIPSAADAATELITPDEVPIDLDGGLFLAGGHSLRVTPTNIASALDITIQGADYTYAP